MDDNDIELALDEFDSDSDVSGSEYVPSTIDFEDSFIDFKEFVLQHLNMGGPLDGELLQGNGQPQQNNSSVCQHPSNIIHVWGNCTDTVRQFPFIQTSGIQVNLIESDPMNIYEKFLSNDVIDLIVTETNRFAEQFLFKIEVSRRFLMYHWKNCDRNKMRRFLGIIILMGMCPLPNMRLYWSNKEMFKNDVIQNAMKRNRFECILKCLHFHDNDIVDTSKPRLSKIKELLIC